MFYVWNRNKPPYEKTLFGPDTYCNIVHNYLRDIKDFPGREGYIRDLKAQHPRELEFGLGKVSIVKDVAQLTDDPGFMSLSSAVVDVLSSAFLWSDTEQGFGYWARLVETLLWESDAQQ